MTPERYTNFCKIILVLSNLNCSNRQPGQVKKCRNCDRHSFGSKPTRAILLCPWERHFTALSPACRSWQAVLNFSHISKKTKKQNKIISNGWQCLGIFGSRSK